MSNLDHTPHRSRPIAGRGRGPLRVRRRRAGVALTIGFGLAIGLTACDTGDGKTLPDPVGTLPPTTVAPASTEPPSDGVGTLASLPMDSPSDDVDAPGPVDGFTVTAPWLDGDEIEVINTCDGDDLSPALSWGSVPAGAVELAVAMVDESIGDGTPFVHWTLAGIGPDAIGLTEGETPLGAIRGLNSFGNLGYDGPCPPPGDPAHVYRLTVYALNQQVELADGATSEDLLGFIQNVTIASTDVTGTHRR